MRKSTRNDSAWIHVKPSLTCARWSSGSACSAKNITTDATNASAINAVASQPALGSPIFLPKSNNTTAPSAGNAGMTQVRSSKSRAVTSALEHVQVVGRHVLPAAEDRHDDGEADGDLRGRDHEREEHDHLAADVVQRLGERDEGEI